MQKEHWYLIAGVIASIIIFAVVLKLRPELLLKSAIIPLRPGGGVLPI